jgi:acyl-CoA synthetase (NDP forming)
VAVIGAGRTRGGVGADVLHRLLTGGFRGSVFPINPHAPSVQGVRAYARTTDVPDPVDLAIVAVPANCVSSVVDDCIAKRVGAIVVISAGFAETGTAGAALEAVLRDRVRAARIPMVGPNCLGVLNTAPDVRLDATFAASLPPAGSIAFASQSGALGLAILAQARQLGLGISSFVSIGNAADVALEDLVDYWGRDEHTRVILLYVEQIADPRRFRDVARRVSRLKPILAVKAGRSTAGVQAAQSHTGALAADDTLVDALYREAGVLRVDTLQELFDSGAVLASQPVPAGNRVAVVTNAGGPGILAADAASAAGLSLPRASETTMAGLRAFLPANAAVANPIDMIATATADDYRRALTLVLDDPAFDSVLVLYTPIFAAVDDVAAAITEAAAGAQKPVLATFFGAIEPALLAPLPCFTFPEASARALSQAVTFARARGPLPIRPEPTVATIDAPRAQRIVDRSATAGGWLSSADCLGLMAACGIPVVPTTLVHTIEDACAVATRHGYPVAVKGAGPTLVHKTDTHAVFTGLADERAVRAAAGGLLTRSDVDGVVVQPMATGVEMLAGVTWRERFGPAVVCGAGGTFTELLHDSACHLTPVSDRDAGEMIERLRSRPRLRGFRGAPACDEASLRSVLVRLSLLAEACPRIREIDVNPLFIGQIGALAADVRVRIAALV